MNSNRKIHFSGGNPLANALVIVVGSLMIALSLVLGFFAFLAIGSLVLVLAAVIGVRVWWLQRKLRKEAGNPSTDRDGRPQSVEIIEGEYRIVSRDEDDRPL